MKNYLIFLLIFVVCIGTAKKCNKKSDNEPIIQVYSNAQERTDKGALIASISGVTPEFRNTVDASLTQVFNDARAVGYTENLEYWKVIIYALHNCVLSPETQTPSFLIRADVYDGTVFDQDTRAGIGKIYAAEFVITHPEWAGLQLTDEYIICQSDNADYVWNATRYGREHKILFDNDRPKFQNTWYHGAGVNHPIMDIIANNKADTTAAGAKNNHYLDFGGSNVKGRIKIVK